MSQDLVKCPCCEKMVPAIDIELTYRKPEAIASMTEEEITASCKYTNDYYVCEDKYFYIRGLLPLPVLNTERDYNLGVWAQVSPSSFNRIWELWDDAEQFKEPPFAGLLANNVHLHSESENIEIEVELTGPTTRPIIRVKATESSLYQEQQFGITVHRASEYSELCR